MDIKKLAGFLDDFLGINEWDDRSINGLQVEGRQEVNKAVFSVDACMDAFHMAKEEDADILVVHHGLIWGGIDCVKGLIKRRLKFLLENEISLYAAHLPLDAHPEIGNNAELLKIAGADMEEPFGTYHGRQIGYSGSFRDPVSLDELSEALSRELKTNPKILRFGKEEVMKVAAVSGGGSFAVPEAAEKKIDVLITGEAEHSAYHTAKESQLNVIFAGHYATETVGVRALMGVVKDRFDIEVEFLDIPTDL
jgi:dinuclear metal center YbgI/SA1388 family protein